MTRWNPDGWEAIGRIGVLAPHADVGPEAELQAMAPSTVTIHAARVPFGAMAAGGAMDPTIPVAPVRAFAEPPHVDDAAELLAAAPLGAIAYGFTSSAYVIGAEGEAAVIAERPGAGLLRVPRFRGRPSRALRPPERSGEDHSRRPVRVGHGEHACRGRCGGDRGNGFRAVGAIHALENDLGRPVVTANQALLWAALVPPAWSRASSDPVEALPRKTEHAHLQRSSR